MAGFKLNSASLLIKKGLKDYHLIPFLNESHKGTKHPYSRLV
jgi:hypothetical protein